MSQIPYDVPDQWKLDSGLREEVERFTIVSAYFAKTANYQDGKAIRIYLNGFDEDTETVTVKMSVGADWESIDGGKTIVHATKSRINMTSTYGHWLRNAFEIEPLRLALVEADTGKGPTRAEVWLNMVLKLDAKEFQMGRKADDNPPRRFLMPTGYYGYATDAPTGQATQQSASVATAQPAPTTPAQSPAEKIAAARAQAAAVASGQVSPLMAQLQQLARDSGTFTDFMSKAFEIPEVLADDQLATAVATSDNGIYAQAKG